MNQGISVATGDFIGLINADDWLVPNAINTIVESIKKHKNIDIFHGNINSINNSSIKVVKPTENLKDFFWKGMSYMHPTFYVKKEIYKKLNYDENYKLLSDYKFTMECFQKGFTFYHIDETLVNYTLGGASSVFFKRIQEGHTIRLALGFPHNLVYLSTVLRISITIASKIKNSFKNS